MVLREETVSYNLPNELAEIVRLKIREFEAQGLISLPVKYINQNTTIDAAIPGKIRGGATNVLPSVRTITHNNQRYEIGSFLGDPRNRQFKTHYFHNISGMLYIPLKDINAVSLVVLHPNTKDSPFNKNGEVTLYEIVNPARELAIATHAEEVKRYTEFFIEKKLHGASFQTVAKRMGISNTSDFVAAKGQIKNKLKDKQERLVLLQSLEASSDAFIPFTKVIEKVYASEYTLSTDSKTGAQTWYLEGEVIAKVEERDATIFLSLLDYEAKLESEKVKAAEKETALESEKPVEPTTNKSTTKK